MDVVSRSLRRKATGLAGCVQHRIDDRPRGILPRVTPSPYGLPGATATIPAKARMLTPGCFNGQVSSAAEHPHLPCVEHLLENNRRYVDNFADHDLQLRPRRKLAIVACMDSRMDIFQMLGLDHGDAHIIRNAGGVVTDDVIRSLVLSQRFLGTREIVLIHHTDCGLQRVVEDELKAEIEEETGMRPTWSFESFRDPYADVVQSINRVRANPFVAFKDLVRGFVYRVEDGSLVEPAVERSE